MRDVKRLELLHEVLPTQSVSVSLPKPTENNSKPVTFRRCSNPRQRTSLWSRGLRTEPLEGNQPRRRFSECGP
jgi:hypothetical protein